MQTAIEISMLSKQFGETLALDSLNLAIPQGSVYGLLGPNGAGKTTTIRLLATLLTPSAGTAKVLGLDLHRDAAKIRSKISLTGQFASVDDELTGKENLVLLGRLLGLGWRGARERAKGVLASFGLEEAANRQVETYSGGMRRRLDIAASLIVLPDILFLDEPTTGLDPRSRNQVWDIVREIAKTGATVLLTTQYLEEADRLADRLAVIDRGRLIAEGTSRDLKNKVGAGAIKIELRDVSLVPAARNILMAHQDDHFGLKVNGATISCQVVGSDEAMNLLFALREQKIPINDFSLGAPSLDEVFFALTGAQQICEKP